MPLGAPPDRWSPACRWAVRGVAALYGFALAVWLVAEFGLFGQPRDPLGGLFLVPLGLPWNLLVQIAPERASAWLAAAAPLVNLLLLAVLCRWQRTRSRTCVEN